MMIRYLSVLAITIALTINCVACTRDMTSGQPGANDINPSSESAALGVFRSDKFYLTIKLPPGWAAVEGPEYLAHPFEGQVAFNSWGQDDFWAREVQTENSYQYGPHTVMSQIPEGGAYVALVRIWGPARSPDYNPSEYIRNDFGGLLKPHDWRLQSASGAKFIEFFKWGRDLRLEVGCNPEASDATVAELNDLLESWRFDLIPAGDIEWAGTQARQLLPKKVKPLEFSIRPGIRGSDGVIRITEVEVRGKTVHFRFQYRWNVVFSPGPTPSDCPSDSCHWWEIDVLPTGKIVLSAQGGATLPDN